MNPRRLSTKQIFTWLLVLLIILAVVSVALGGGGWFRILRLMVFFAAVFLAIIFGSRKFRG